MQTAQEWGGELQYLLLGNPYLKAAFADLGQLYDFGVALLFHLNCGGAMFYLYPAHHVAMATELPREDMSHRSSGGITEKALHP